MSRHSGAIATLVFVVATVAPAFAQPLVDRLTIVAPAAPGGGWDQTARSLQHVFQADQLVRVVDVQNVPGAAGTIGLSQFITAERGNGRVLLVSGLVMLGATLWNRSPVSVTQVTPIARLTGEYEVIAVPATSPYRDLQSVVRAFRQRPESFAWGGGSAGGTDHILAGLLAEAAGVDARRVNYIAFSGGGEAVAALLGGHVAAGISGYSEFASHIASGRLRALSVSSPSPIAGVDVPTMKEGGVDVELANWRAVLAPAGISSDDRSRLTTLVRTATQSHRWRQILADREWTDLYLDGGDFEQYLQVERTRLTRIVARLRGPGGETPIPVGQRIVPAAVCIGAVVVLIAFIANRIRGGAVRPSTVLGATLSSSSQDDRELVERSTGREPPLQAAPPANRVAIAVVCWALVTFAAFLPSFGFVIAATVLFAGTAFAFRLGGATPARFDGRDAARLVTAGVVFSTIVYLAFTRGLDLTLPAGSLWTWMR